MSDGEELRLIAEQLLMVAQRRDQNEKFDLPNDRESPDILRRKTNLDPIAFADPDTLAQLASGLYESRRIRDRYFKNDLFADPAWDILLDLFVQKSTGKRVSITSACIASGVPPTTGLRWVSLLVDEGLVVREEDEVDRRRAFLRLSKEGEKAMQRSLIDTMNFLRSSTNKSFFFGRGKK